MSENAPGRACSEIPKSPASRDAWLGLGTAVHEDSDRVTDVGEQLQLLTVVYDRFDVELDLPTTEFYATWIPGTGTAQAARGATFRATSDAITLVVPYWN